MRNPVAWLGVAGSFLFLACASSGLGNNVHEVRLRFVGDIQFQEFLAHALRVEREHRFPRYFNLRPTPAFLRGAILFPSFPG